MTRHENKNKKRKKWRYVHRKIAIIQRFNFEDTKQISQIRMVEIKETTYGEA